MTNANIATSRGVARPSRKRGSLITLREQMLKDEQQRLAVASRIRELRGPAPQPVIAEKVGVGLRGYQKWEATGGIGWENLQKLAKVHGVDVDWILYGNREKPETPDLMATVNGNVPDDLRAQVQDLHAKVDRIIDALGLDKDADQHPLDEISQIAARLPELLAADDETVATTETRPAGS